MLQSRIGCKTIDANFQHSIKFQLNIYEKNQPENQKKKKKNDIFSASWKDIDLDTYRCV